MFEGPTSQAIIFEAHEKRTERRRMVIKKKIFLVNSIDCCFCSIPLKCSLKSSKDENGRAERMRTQQNVQCKNFVSKKKMDEAM